jgi:UDP-glucose 4-epimerase
VRRLLADGHDVRAVIRPGTDAWRLDGVAVERVELDLRAGDLAARLLDRPTDWVFHLATHGAYSWQTNESEIVATTLDVTAGLLDAVVEREVEAFVHAGSSSEYGPKAHAPDEEEPLEPTTVYGSAKAAATALCRRFARSRDRHVVTLRLYSVYGPFEEPRRFVPTLLVRGLAGSLPPLVAPGTARDFVYVDDVCDAFVGAAVKSDLPRGTVLNVGTGRQTTIGEAVAIVRSLLGVEAEPEWESHAPRPWDTDCWIANPARARELLGWEAGTGLEEGFRATVDWLRASPLLGRVYRPAIGLGG